MAIEWAAAVATIKAVASVAKDAGRIDLYQKVLDLQVVLQEAMTTNITLSSDNTVLARKCGLFRVI